MPIRFDSMVRAALAAAFICAGPAHAQEPSAWSDDLRSQIRLIAGGKQDDALLAAIEIKLQPGWKTYWRYPGDSGVPPRFEFAGSDNLLRAQVLWPAPHAFTDEGGTSIGYKDSVIFPLRVVPRDPAKPVTLRLKLDYAVCEKLCIPALGKAEVTVSGATTAQTPAIAQALAQVPKPVPASALGFSAKRVTATIKPLVAIDLAAPGNGRVEVFAEGPNAEWALPIPKPALGAPAGRRHFEMTLDGLPPGVDPKGPFELTFTIVGAQAPVEVTTRLD
ncbi:MAG: cytochrome C biogenesis protein [Pseudolabrys sp.]|nr:cytochrome C biogenesis protein [Pseudolabrys sp.]